MTVDKEFVEMMYHGHPKGWIAIFDNAHMSACEGRSASPFRDLPPIPRLVSWKATAYRSGS